MKKKLVKSGVLLGVFVVSIVLMSFLFNQKNIGITDAMSEAVNPVITILNGDGEINRLFGYEGEMQDSYMRDTLTPISDSQEVKFLLDADDSKIQKAAFELKSADGVTVIEKGDIAIGNEIEKGAISASYKIQTALEKDVEYILKLNVLVLEETELSYYTRVRLASNMNVDEKLAFVNDFHQKTFNSTDVKELTKYLEPNETGDNTTLNKVNIHSSLNQVAWNGLEVKKTEEPVCSILEMDSSTGAFQMSYPLTIKTERGQMEDYTVKEFYRVRYTANRIYLLDFERSMDQIFNPQNDVLSENKLTLGITSEDVEYIGNEKGTVVGFVQNGDLWCYNGSMNKMTRVFGFRDEKGYDVRNSYDQYDIRIMGIDEVGNMEFMVYGYMNRGRHEGTVGSAVYHFDHAAGVTEEVMFIPYTKSFQVLKEDLGNVSYVNKAGQLYMTLDRNLYEIDLENRTFKTVISNLEEDSYVATNDRKKIAWQEPVTPEGTQNINIMDLETGETDKVTSAQGEFIKPVGFMGSDFIYGAIRQGDVTKDMSGNEMMPMYGIWIQNEAYETIKEYQVSNIYIMSANISGNIIELERVTQDAGGGGFSPTNKDTIVNNSQKEEEGILLKTVTTKAKEKEIQFILSTAVEGIPPKIIQTKEIIFQNQRNVVFTEQDNQNERYYTYAQGKLQGVFSKVNQAILKASETSGVVINEKSNYIWQKGSRPERNIISSIIPAKVEAGQNSRSVCLNEMLRQQGVTMDTTELINQGESVGVILEANLQVDAIDLSGCEMDSVLYYVGKGNPVMATMADRTTILIVGYDGPNITVMNPQNGILRKMGMKDSKADFEAAGNEFISYIKK